LSTDVALGLVLKQLYQVYVSSNPSLILQTGKELYQQGLIDEQRPQIYSHAGDQFGKGNPWVPYNNPTDTLLNSVRVGTYFDDSLKPLLNSGEGLTKYIRLISFIWAFLFFNRTLQIVPSNTESQQYANAIVSRLKLSAKDILNIAYSLSEYFKSSEWLGICKGLLNNVPQPPTMADPKAYLEYTDERLKKNPNDAMALLMKGVSLYNIAQSNPSIGSKISLFGESMKLLNKAIDINPALYAEYQNIIQKIIGDSENIISSQTKNNIDTDRSASQKKDIGIQGGLNGHYLTGSRQKLKEIKYYTSDGKPVYE